MTTVIRESKPYSDGVKVRFFDPLTRTYRDATIVGYDKFFTTYHQYAIHIDGTPLHERMYLHPARVKVLCCAGGIHFESECPNCQPSEITADCVHCGQPGAVHGNGMHPFEASVSEIKPEPLCNCGSDNHYAKDCINCRPAAYPALISAIAHLARNGGRLA